VRGALELLRDHYSSAAAFLQVKQSSTAGAVEVAHVSPPIVEPETKPYPIGDSSFSSSSSASTSSSVSISSYSSSISTSSSSSSIPISTSPIAVQPEIKPYPICELVSAATKPIYIGGGGTRPETQPQSSDAGASIISLLEVIESDFTKSLAEAQTDEDAAQAEYDKTSTLNKWDKIAKEKDVKYKGQQVLKLEKELAELKSDLDSKHTELDAILDYWNSLTAQCVAKPESFEERNRRRQAEIDGLKEALRILTTETALVQVSKGALRGAHRNQ